MATIECVGAVVTKIGVTIYTADGGARSLAQSDYRTADVLAKVMLGLSTEGLAKIELEEFSLAKRIAEATGGAVKIEINDAGKEALVTEKGRIDNIAPLHTVLAHASEGVGVVGLPKFIEYFSQIKRQHSQQELLDFIEKQKLPIADDGTIIVYKRLKSAHNQEGYYVDSYTSSVKQRVGSIVTMPDSRVDPNRYNDCSVGFHVASESYIPSFKGDKLIICKVNPKHVVAVPKDYDHSKMRVSEYTIVAEVPEKMAQRLFNRGRFNDDEDSAAFLGRIVAGQHPAPVEFVEESERGKITVTPIERADRKELASEKTEAKPVRNLEDRPEAVAISPSQVRETVKQIKKHGADALNTAKAKAKEYAKKLNKARKMWQGGDGKTISEIAKKLQMDRNVLAKHLKSQD